ncbi:hypothetical protein [Paracoccus sp. (in: a-proteobacteria)]|uniref:hypothetical protein n=1 Tax=Paracoccus sp. TaxID=267 RepID=UPI0028996F7D|nr:hypothetical protein [Paracoccus sp. (in: a-proteobacteria)]
MSQTSIKKRVFISLPLPATQTIAGYTALTYKQIKGVISVGQIGFPHETIPAEDLESGITKTLKGARQGTGATIPYRKIEADPGQTDVNTANEGEAEVVLQIVDPDGTTADFWTGIIHSLTDNEASTKSIEGQSFVFVPNYAKVRGAAKIPPAP